MRKDKWLLRRLPAALGLVLVVLPLLTRAQPSRRDMKKLVEEDLQFAGRQYGLLMKNLPPGRLPKTFDSATGKIQTSGPQAWTSGFYPGTLWYLYSYSHDTAFRQEAERSMKLLEKEQYYKGTHDLGFMMYCSFGNAWRLTHDDSDRKVLLTSARSLSTRFNDTVGCIKSWDHGPWTYPVIIDNMMNLELLCWASRTTGDDRYIHMAESHADNTMKNHFRADYSSWHVVDYDPHTGRVLQKKTAQGYSDASAWARGQSWGLYGYTMMYRETGDKRYLSQARHIAAFILNNPHLPADGVPYWDYDAPDIPHAYRDASAAAIMASALLELSTFTKNHGEAGRYRRAAEKILVSLSSSAYRCKPGACGGFLLMHSVGSLPGHSEVDVPLSYADYYFVEALLRYKKWFLKGAGV
jgi:rhamnogalacturonyl hydrolase YesR